MCVCMCGLQIVSCLDSEQLQHSAPSNFQTLAVTPRGLADVGTFQVIETFMDQDSK